MTEQQDRPTEGRTPEEILADSAVAFDYGRPNDEYRAVREGAGVVERNDLAHLVLSGRDPVRMVQGLMTNDLLAAGEDRAVYGAMLTPKGKVIAEMRALRVTREEGEEVWIDLPREVLVAATAHLRRSVPPMYARWRDASVEVACLGVYGPRARELLGATLRQTIAPLAEDEVIALDDDGTPLRIIGTRYAGGEEGYDLILPRPDTAELRDRLLTTGAGWAAPVGFAALETLRIEAGRPRGGRELTDATIPTEAFESTGLMERAISFRKGCYTGQEVIVRIAHRGHVNRVLRGLILQESSSSAVPGARLHHPDSGREVGWITSVAESPLLGHLIALAFLRREVEPGQRVHVGSAGGDEAEVSGLPFGVKKEAT